MADKDAHDDDKYLTENSVEIAQILRELAKNKTTLNLSFNYGKDQGLTTVIGLSRDKKSAYIDKSLDAGFNNRLLNSETIVFSKTDGIKIRWTSKQIAEVRLKDGDAFKIPLPKKLYRFQRREFFRSPTPTTNPVICRIPYRNPTNDMDEELKMTLVDASLGGIGAMESDHLSSLIEPEARFEHCKINLPDYGLLDVKLCVKHITETIMLNGAKKFRIGFQFVNLSHADERALQKYVLHLEREALMLAHQD